ncbi:MAG: ABC transporter ATP-binding protein [Verrucomicrobiota bacterium]
MRVEVQELKRYFGKTRAVDGISFTVDGGHVFGFVGPNGAGKTTTLRILASLDEPTGGDALIGGVSVKEDPEKVRRQIGYVPDFLPAHADITVHEYLDFFARAYGFRGARRRAAVEGVEEFARLTDLREKLLKQLSRGMKQRVSLGRALVHDPPVLVMDEPAAGLDPRARVEFRELLSLLAEQDKAILISSHILTELTEVCNGVVIIEKGRLLRTGTLADIVSADTPVRTITVRPMDNHEGVFKALLEMPRVNEVKRAAGKLLAEVEGTEADCTNILSALVKQDFAIAEFGQIRDDLEDIFMRVTRGEVQ